MAQSIANLAQISVTVAGTRQQISSVDIRTPLIVITAITGNTGLIYIGDSAVSSTKFILELAAGETAEIRATESNAFGEEFSLSDFYVDAATSADKINVGYIKRR